jgi:YhcH/YjgK/YiaL family protein
LDGEQLFAIVLDAAKDEADTRFEAHKKYADIQYVIDGRERIGVVPLASARMVEPYDDAQDIAFFETNENNYRPASAKIFFVFFPDDVHRPGVRIEGEQVKKIVIKVQL